jgi:probable HAF family extracellular repeat protein
MHTHRSHLLAGFVIGIALVTVIAAAPLRAPAASAQPEYSVADLGTLGGGTIALGINDKTQAVGGSVLAGGSFHAFVFQQGALSDLGTLPGGNNSEAFGLNESGQVVGTSGTAGVPSYFGHAFIFSDQRMRDLGTLGGTWSEAFGINERGEVAGGSAIAGDQTAHAFLYRKGKLRDINPRGSAGSVAYGINDSGAVVGYAFLKRGPHAFVYSDEHVTDLGTLGGSGSGAKAINQSGEIVGNANLEGDSMSHAFLYRNKRMIDLGSFGGNSEALAINDYGSIVGYSWTLPGSGGGPPGGPFNEIHAFISDGRTMVNLNDLIASGSGWTLDQATGINNLGQIVGYGMHDGEQRSFLLTPVS